MNQEGAAFKTLRRIEFADTDLGGLVHFSRFFVFMETAEHELLRSLGTEVHQVLDGRQIGWPRVEATCRYLRPVHFGDELEIVVSVLRVGTRSMTYSFAMSRDGELAADGRLASVCCQIEEGGQPVSIDIPAPLAEALKGLA